MSITWTNCKLKLSELKKWENNPAEITKEAAGRLVDCFNEFGQIETLAVDPENRLVDGHQRLDTWLAKYGDIEVDCRKASRLLTEKERQKIAVMLRSGAVGRYNWDVVSGWNSDDLKEWGFDAETLKDWKQDVSALDKFIESEKQESIDAEPQIDRAAELNEKWQVKTGDLWQIGEHRLLCGDSTVKADVEMVMGGDEAETLVSDPPYGINYEYDNHNDASNEENKNLVMKVMELAPESKIWSCGLMNLARELSWNPSAKVLCWHKGFAQAGSGLGGASTWEPFLVVGVKNGTLPNDYLKFTTDREPGLRELHSCPKPVELFNHLIEHLAGQIIYEPFCGSGTTMVACENLHRKCRAIEISPNYCAVILQRMSDAFPELEIKRLNEQTN